MYKQSTYVIALFLGTTQAFIDAPASNNYFATGMNGDEDLGEDITMKGNKFHFNQQPTNNANVQISYRGDGEDISEKGMNENVHWFANPNTETLNWPRRETPYDYNGSSPRAFPVSYPVS
jgi:hypothetical protein